MFPRPPPLYRYHGRPLVTSGRPTVRLFRHRRRTPSRSYIIHPFPPVLRSPTHTNQKPLQKLSPTDETSIHTHIHATSARMFVFRILFICSLRWPVVLSLDGPYIPYTRTHLLSLYRPSPATRDRNRSVGFFALPSHFLSLFRETARSRSTTVSPYVRI